MKFHVFVALNAMLSCFGAVGQPFHGKSTTSAVPNPSLQEFSPSTSRDVRRIVSENFDLVYDLRKVDSGVLTAFYSKVPAGEIANRRKPFNATDVQIGNRPFRRFVLAGYATGIWFVFYEHGGRGYHHHLLIFSRDGNKWRLAAAAAGLVKENTLQSLKEALNERRFFYQPGDIEY
jgi:hypothetical protein